MRKSIFFLTLFFATCAYANTGLKETSSEEIEQSLKTIQTSYEKCMNSAGATLEENMCKNEKYNSTDELLTQFYAKTIHRLQTQMHQEMNLPQTSQVSQEIVKRLVTSQRAWINYRYTNCQLQGINGLGGSSEGNFIADCLSTTTVQRIKEIVKLNL